jgi:hypothetical protein
MAAIHGSDLYRSTDNGASWTLAVSPVSDTLFGIAWGNGVFVAGTPNGKLITSSDGLTWTIRVSSSSKGFSGVAYGDGVFVAVGGNTLARSTDNGQTWTVTSAPGGAQWNQIGFGNGTFVATSSSLSQIGGVIYCSSDDGQTWTTPDPGGVYNFNGVAYGNGLWVLVSKDGKILTSSAGLTPPPLVPTVNIARAMQLEWQSQSGALYQVQASPDASSWQDVGDPIMGDGLPKTYFDPTPSDTKKFYRIQIK